MIRTGIIGMSPGNAHPYSWSAIINGQFDGQEITAAGYPAVSKYLVANGDTLGLDGMLVTHVWTQDRQLSASIARTTGIAHIVDDVAEMIGQVDAVILSRDDAEHHVAMARPFIDAGIPIFIDKPLALTTEDLAYFSSESSRGKLIMSCSSMRYAGECRTAKTELEGLGWLELVTAVGKKDWNKYGVHLLEAVFAILDEPRPVSVRHAGRAEQDIVVVEFEDGLQASFHLFMDISSTFQFSLFGQRGWRLVEVKNSYSMFRDNIIEFARSVRERRSRVPFHFTETIIRTLIGARESLEQGGKTIFLSGVS